MMGLIVFGAETFARESPGVGVAMIVVGTCSRAPRSSGANGKADAR